LKIPFEVVDHQAGIRPAIADRRPVIGRHPDFKPLYIFNGLGSKGAMLTPTLAQIFINQLDSESILDKETDPSRFKT
jgi:glycine/D-amino acid oxidase-like deaminating enzyme